MTRHISVIFVSRFSHTFDETWKISGNISKIPLKLEEIE